MGPNSLSIPFQFVSKNRQQSYALVFACYATLKRGRGGVTKYFDVSSEEKTVNDQDFDTDCSLYQNSRPYFPMYVIGFSNILN